MQLSYSEIIWLKFARLQEIFPMLSLPPPQEVAPGNRQMGNGPGDRLPSLGHTCRQPAPGGPPSARSWNVTTLDYARHASTLTRTPRSFPPCGRTIGRTVSAPYVLAGHGRITPNPQAAPGAQPRAALPMRRRNGIEVVCQGSLRRMKVHCGFLSPPQQLQARRRMVMAAADRAARGWSLFRLPTG